MRAPQRRVGERDLAHLCRTSVDSVSVRAGQLAPGWWRTALLWGLRERRRAQHACSARVSRRWVSAGWCCAKPPHCSGFDAAPTETLHHSVLYSGTGRSFPVVREPDRCDARARGGRGTGCQKTSVCRCAACADNTSAQTRCRQSSRHQTENPITSSRDPELQMPRVLADALAA